MLSGSHGYGVVGKKQACTMLQCQEQMLSIVRWAWHAKDLFCFAGPTDLA